jgi:asparagine synthase (glutamine-hydrolysing)
MCGIFGVIGDEWLEDFGAALGTLRARGPDERGEWHGGPAHLGHRRLEIIDPQGGGQPMVSPDGRLVIVYNGEIYNFRELRRELEGRGLRFRTASDTEVLLAGLREWGALETLPKLDGMFAFALWDAEACELFLARDRVGIKPLYWSEAGGGLVFASTVAPFLGLRGFPRRLDGAAVREYLAAGFIPAPLSILRDVRALEPAGWLRYAPGRGVLERGRYWAIPPPTRQPMRFEALVEATDAALAESTRRQLVADVPLGAFLSGGIDSSLLVHYMAAASPSAVRTFTVRFDQSRRHDESWAARAVARAVGAEHHELAASTLGAEALLEAVAAMDQPFGDPSFLPLAELCRLARRHITVAISGDGGDELFGGYYRYGRDASRYPAGAAYRMLKHLAESGLLPQGLYRNSLRGDARVLRNFSRMGDYPVSTRALRSILSPEAAEAFRVQEAMESWARSVRAFSGRMDGDSLMRADLWHFLSENGLVKADRASMMRGLEVRVPLLGAAVVDLALPQPAAVKMQGGRKAVLRALARRHLPREVWGRSKHGFSVPLGYYFRGPWRELGEELFGSAGELAPFFDAAELRRRYRLELAGRSVDWPLYAVFVLLAWLRLNPLRATCEGPEPALAYAAP